MLGVGAYYRVGGAGFGVRISGLEAVSSIDVSYYSDGEKVNLVNLHTVW